MYATAFIWVLCTAAVFVALAAGRTSRLHRRLRMSDLDWKAILVLALIAGAVPAFIYDQVSHRTVDLPDAVINEVVVPTP